VIVEEWTASHTNNPKAVHLILTKMFGGFLVSIMAVVCSCMLCQYAAATAGQQQFLRKRRTNRVDLSNKDLYGHIVRAAPAPLTGTHKIVLAVKHSPTYQSALDALFDKITDPSSPNFRDFRDRKQLFEDLHGDTTSSSVTESLDQIMAYLSEHCSLKCSYTVNKYGNFVSVVGTVEVLNKMLDTEFHLYEVSSAEDEQQQADHLHSRRQNPRKSGKVLVRAEEYSVPEVLSAHIESIFNVNQFPAPLQQMSWYEPIVDDDGNMAANSVNSFSSTPVHINDPTDDPTLGSHPVGLGSVSQYITPEFLNSHYNIIVNGSGSLAGFGSQLVYSTIGQSFSPSDLHTFQDTFGLPALTPDTSTYDFNQMTQLYDSDAACKSVSNCVEGNLDVQYTLSVSPYNKQTYFSYDDSDDYFLLNWMVNMSDTETPALVISISYGILEFYLDDSYAAAFNHVAMLLAMQGVTIVVASGDDGATGYNARTSSRYCGYFPLWPASSPYVMAVGATQGPEGTFYFVACVI
jgi:subtilase family serine protease